MIRHWRETRKADKQDKMEAEAAAAAAAAAATVVEEEEAAPGGGHPVVARPPYTVCNVVDAAFFRIEVTNVTVDFALGYTRDLFPETAVPDFCYLQCPLSNEDCYRDMRRPAYTAQITQQNVFLTARERANPFAYFSLKAWPNVQRSGFSFVTCLRPEWGMHACFYVRSRHLVMGSAIIPFTDGAGVPLARAEGVSVPLTRGGLQTGTVTCDIRLVQLAIPPTW
jgi:hypothetical protein